MIIDKVFVPKYIVADLFNGKTKIRVNKGWFFLNVNEKYVEVFHEKYGALKLSSQESHFKLVHKLVLGEDVIIGSYFDCDDINCILLDLWKKGLFHIVAESQFRLPIPERYKWFFQTLQRFEGMHISPHDMLKKLMESRVTIVGLGGLGGTLAVLLSANGIENLHIVDGDTIEESNLSRQLFYTNSDIGEKKAMILAKHIKANNPNTNINIIDKYVSSYEDAMSLSQETDFMILCADEPRFKIQAWIGKACLDKNVPLIIMANNWIGPILGSKKSPCYGCLARYHSSFIPNIHSVQQKMNGAETPPRGAFGPGPLLVAGYISSLVLFYLSNIDKETYLNKRHEISLFGMGKEEEVTKYFDCPICGG